MSEALNLHDTTDASVWAHEFCKRFTSAFCEIEGKEGVMIGEDYEATMIGWFANAIMAGVDSEARIRADRIEALGRACTEWAEVSQSNYQRAKAAEAKLAKAVEALGLIVVDNTWGLEHETYMKCRTTLAEIKGESHE